MVGSAKYTFVFEGEPTHSADVDDKTKYTFYFSLDSVMLIILIVL